VHVRAKPRTDAMTRLVVQLAIALPAAACCCATAGGARLNSLIATFDKHLYPVADLDLRNAVSRTDGYWPYVAQKEAPPQALTYGEFPLPLFAQLVDRACAVAALDQEARQQAVFCDIGSGCGRLVLFAAAAAKWKAVRGVELLQGLHEQATKKRDLARSLHAEGKLDLLTDAEHIDLVNGSWEDPVLTAWEEIDVVFAYTTALPVEHGVLCELSDALSPLLREGCVVCTTDYQLCEKRFEVISQVAGENEGVGGTSVGYVHRKKCRGQTETERLLQQIDLLEDVVATTRHERDDALEALATATAEADALRDEIDTLRSQLDSEEDDDEDVDALRAWAANAGYDIS